MNKDDKRKRLSSDFWGGVEVLDSERCAEIAVGRQQSDFRKLKCVELDARLPDWMITQNQKHHDRANWGDEFDPYLTMAGQVAELIDRV